MIVLVEASAVLVSTVISGVALRRIISRESRSIADYGIVLLWLFNGLPILLDLTVGPPDYGIWPWFSYLEIAVSNEAVRLTYAAYYTVLMLVLAAYSHHWHRRHSVGPELMYVASNSSVFRGPMLLAISILPFLLVLMSGNVQAFLEYGDLSSRVSGGIYDLIFASELIGIFAFFCWYFEERVQNSNLLVLLLYSGAILWVDGKRYLIATILLVCWYFYMNSRKVVRISMRKVAVAAAAVAVLFGGFYVWYSQQYKTVDLTWDGVYLAARTDFGRDDVTKFVLYREIVEERPILEYRGASMLSSVLVFVPRSVWPAKPYPHYRYLTAALYGTSVLSIPAGMTPSILETSVANFGVGLGMAACCVILTAICRLADGTRSVPRRVLYLILLAALLTQSLDAVLGVLMVLGLGFAPRFAAASMMRSRRYGH